MLQAINLCEIQTNESELCLLQNLLLHDCKSFQLICDADMASNSKRPNNPKIAKDKGIEYTTYKRVTRIKREAQVIHLSELLNHRTIHINLGVV